MAIRSNNLAAGIRNLLEDQRGEGLAKELYDHPLVKGLAKKDRVDEALNKVASSDRWGKPAYIPSRTFALALLDIVAPNAEGATNPTDVHRKVKYSEWFKDQNDGVKRTLLLLIDNARGDLEATQKNIERWYDDAMDRVTSWYKRKAHLTTIRVAA